MGKKRIIKKEGQSVDQGLVSRALSRTAKKKDTHLPYEPNTCAYIA